MCVVRLSAWTITTRHYKTSFLFPFPLFFFYHAPPSLHPSQSTFSTSTTHCHLKMETYFCASTTDSHFKMDQFTPIVNDTAEQEIYAQALIDLTCLLAIRQSGNGHSDASPAIEDINASSVSESDKTPKYNLTKMFLDSLATLFANVEGDAHKSSAALYFDNANELLEIWIARSGGLASEADEQVRESLKEVLTAVGSGDSST